MIGHRTTTLDLALLFTSPSKITMNSKQRRKLIREIQTAMVEVSDTELKAELVWSTKIIMQLEREVEHLRRKLIDNGISDD